MALQTAKILKFEPERKDLVKVLKILLPTLLPSQKGFPKRQ